MIAARSSDPAVEQCIPIRKLQDKARVRAILVAEHVPRFFTLPQAEGLLPEVERLLRDLIRYKDDYTEADAQLTAVLHRVAMAGGMIPPRDEIARLRSLRDSCGRSLKSTFERFQETGCQLKDIDTGLVDFPTLYRDQEVYLCWKLGESGIGFWHAMEDGFRGRKPSTASFWRITRATSSRHSVNDPSHYSQARSTTLRQ